MFRTIFVIIFVRISASFFYLLGKYISIRCLLLLRIKSCDLKFWLNNSMKMGKINYLRMCGRSYFMWPPIILNSFHQNLFAVYNNVPKNTRKTFRSQAHKLHTKYTYTYFDHCQMLVEFNILSEILFQIALCEL